MLYVQVLRLFYAYMPVLPLHINAFEFSNRTYLLKQRIHKQIECAWHVRYMILNQLKSRKAS